MSGVGQIHQIARGHRHLGREPRPFTAEGILEHLHHDLLAFMEQSADGRCVAVAVIAIVDADSLRQHVAGVQKRSALQVDIDECGLHARKHPDHPTLINVSDNTAGAGTLDVHFLQNSVFHHGDAGFLGGDIDENFFAHEVEPGFGAWTG